MKLLEKYKLNSTIEMQNRIVMAPLTRCFATDELVPTQLMADYYEKRADAGLIITEATIVTKGGQGYPNTPGLFSKEQGDGWKLVTDKVHKRGGKIFAQLWHVGRVSHSIYLNGNAPVAPSAVLLAGRVPRAEDLEYPMPRALEISEIETIIQEFKQAAINAIEAGFDGVEIHGANGYLIDQFLHQHTNLRDDQYGGSVANRARFALQIIDETIKAIGSHRVGIRLSPAAYFNMEYVKGDEDTFDFLLEMINDKNMAYVHVGIFDDTASFDYLGGTVSEYIRSKYKGVLIASGGKTSEVAEQDLHLNKYDLVAIGRPFIANPDYVSRVRSNSSLVDYNESMLTSLV
ncbi:alkene reductase [Halobacteriovorax sp. HLS]|uniref:alkene reductase n=1 Tax=Halobacteriovorax sp. HLS TaxID=2234000 RepID=UPI000FDAF5D8|nr:alkene reductase [Halobacteriovorax sp. HLS]